MAEVKELSPYEKELLEAIKKVIEYKLPSEANVVSILYKNPSLLYAYPNLSLDLFSNNSWKVYYSIISAMVLDEQIQVIDEISVGLYLEKHPKLKDKYNEYGSWSAIYTAMEYVDEKNLDSSIADLKKWNAVLDLSKMKFPIKDYLSKFADLNAEEIYNLYTAKLNHVFSNVETKIKSCSIDEGLDELIDNLDKGENVGLPYHNLPTLNKFVGGMRKGDFNIIGAISNVGKSSILRNAILPSIIENKEKVVIMINEEGVDKVKTEMLVWVTNNILKKDLQKYIVRDGGYSEETKAILKEAAKWIRDKASDKTITIIPLSTFTTDIAIKEIRKFSAMGVSRFIVDTFKPDTQKTDGKSPLWEELMNNSVRLYDTIKRDGGLNVNLTVTFQLSISSAARLKYLALDNLGNSRAVANVASDVLLIRNLYDDEIEGAKALKVYRVESKTMIPVALSNDRNHHYQVMFIAKTRSGSTSDQIVIDHDLSRNMIKECGITHVPQDGYGGN